MPATTRGTNQKRIGVGDDCERDCGDEQTIFLEIIENMKSEGGSAIGVFALGTVEHGRFQ